MERGGGMLAVGRMSAVADPIFLTATGSVLAQIAEATTLDGADRAPATIWRARKMVSSRRARHQQGRPRGKRTPAQWSKRDHCCDRDRGSGRGFSRSPADDEDEGKLFRKETARMKRDPRCRAAQSAGHVGEKPGAGGGQRQSARRIRAVLHSVGTSGAACDIVPLSLRPAPIAGQSFVLSTPTGSRSATRRKHRYGIVGRRRRPQREFVVTTGRETALRALLRSEHRRQRSNRCTETMA